MYNDFSSLYSWQVITVFEDRQAKMKKLALVAIFMMLTEKCILVKGKEQNILKLIQWNVKDWKPLWKNPFM